jgi:hypothetical protein
MAIARKPNSNRLIPADKAAEQAANAFIQGAAKPEQNTPAPDGELLRRVDLAAKRRGISRSAWIAFKVSEALDAEGS